LAVDIYRLSARFPSAEAFALTSQITRAAASVPANIAEGHARPGRKTYANFVSVAKGSLMEVQTYVALAERLGYVTPDQTAASNALITEISKMLTALRNRLRSQGNDENA
jgi:four helix bundle protein